MNTARVYLQPQRALPFYGRHPWVFAGAIARVDGDPEDGAVVDVFANAGNFVARGLYNSKSKIRVRLYSWSQENIFDEGFLRERLSSAVYLRRSILKIGGAGRACRLVFSESDGLSGCTVDQYDRWLVMQFTSLGLAQRRDLFADVLMDILKPEGIYLRTERGIGQIEGLTLQDGRMRGNVPDEPVQISEDGLQFLVHLTEGQKTGFYLDQSDNRKRVAEFAPGKRVLDAFCYTGGFAIHAHRGGAEEVVGIDISESAVAIARENARLNDASTISFHCGDAFEELRTLANAKRTFGLIILDPPKFARSRSTLREALRGYRKLQNLAVRLLEPNGVLVVCCCSGVIKSDMLEDLLSQIGAQENRRIQIIERRGQAPDHPVSVSCLETSYLKCLIAIVQ